MERKSSFGSGLVEAFLRGNLAILLIMLSLAVGAVALLVTPREEDPQIVVPLANVMISYPGGSAEEVENLVAARLERLLYQIDGVEYVYSMSRPGQAVVTVRFYVGQDREESLIKLYNKIFQNLDKTTPGIAGWVVKPVEIDDVPVVSVTLYSDRYDTHQLYRVAEEAVDKLQHVKDTSTISIHGGQPRVVNIYLDAERLSAHGLSALELAGALKASNAQLAAGTFEQGNASVRVETGPFLQNAREVMNLVVGLHENRPVYLRDVARVEDGPAELDSYTRIGFGPAAEFAISDLRFPISEPKSKLENRNSEISSTSLPAVTIAVAKKKGSNAVSVTREVQAAVEQLRGTVIPDDVQTRVTRDYGATADEKVNDLVKNLIEAIITVIALIAIVMNWRLGLIVAFAVPITYALTLLVNLLAGYTINRVTLFALILALGLLVDDPIVAVENIYRHLSLRKQNKLDAIGSAMREIMQPVTLATLSVIAAFLPMFFITGMMGPYMRPMALNVPLAMLSSLLVSFAITPWLSSKMLKEGGGAGHDVAEDVKTGKVYRFYARMVGPFLASRARARGLLWVTAGLFAGSLALALGVVPLKMLPFDNKNEFQMVVDMPESSTLEKTDAVIRDLEAFLRTQPEVTAFTTYAGTASPMDFNGLVRHYYLRRGPHVGEIRVNLLHRKEREASSHEIVLRIRNEVDAIARRHGANVKLVEIPPGPPVLSTVVAEVYGQPHHTYADLVDRAAEVAARMREEKGVVDVDVSAEDASPQLTFVTDREKAALNGISTEEVAQTVALALGGMSAGTLHVPGEQNELSLTLRLPREARSGAADLARLPIKGRGGDLVQLGELGRFETGVVERTIFHKNQERVVYVTAETAGVGPAYPVLALQSWFKKNPVPEGYRLEWAGEGEWKITVDVFRDLGLAFAAALLIIYMLLVYETGSYALPGVIMLSIPLTMIGIMPGFSILNLLVNREVGGFANPVFFTATAMIGMIALAGIVVRNGIILIDFIRTSVAQGARVQDAIVEAGAVRLRPIVLTAGTTLLGAWPITLDPIFSGLAWSLIFGLFVSTVFTLVIIPVVYGMLYGEKNESTR
jgi:multidrug efflux pump subunit AcrB